jgi:cold shock protein
MERSKSVEYLFAEQKVMAKVAKVDSPKGNQGPREARSERVRGVVRRLVEDKGFGFIESETDHGQYFFHRSALEGAPFEDLRVGTPVEFSAGMGPKGPRAEQIVIVYSEPPSAVPSRT